MEVRGTGTEVGAFVGVQRERADFGAVTAGACVAIGAGALLFALGAAIGLSAIDPTAADWNGRAVMVSGGAWSALAIILATFAGAYTSVRLAGHYSRADAGAHGLATWGLAFVASMAFTSAVSAMTVRTAAGVAGSALEAAGGVAGTPLGENLAERIGDATETTPPSGEAEVPNLVTPSPEQAADAANAAANAGAWASWAFFATALLSAIAGIAGGIWALPEPLRALARPGIRGPNRPLDG
jgi:hypothetical protein